MDDERNHLARQSPAEPTRRNLLRATAGSVILAASGLLLPGLGDAAARDKSHRRKHRRIVRRRRRQDHGNGAQAGNAWLNVALYIHNLRPTGVSVRQWKMTGVDETIRWGLMTDWLPIDGRPETGPEHFIDFVPDLKGFAVEINTGHVVEVSNPLIGFPHLEVREGGWSDHGWDPRGATLINQGFFEGETVHAPGFGAQRLNDTGSHKQFLLDLA